MPEMEPTVLIDCRFASTHSGLGRYTRELVTHLLRLPEGSTAVLLVRSKDEAWIPAGVSVIEADIPHYSLSEQTKLPGIIAQSGASLYFSPHFNVPLRCPLPFVVTVHDLILHRYPNQASLPKQLAYRLLIRSAVRRARSVIAISGFTASEIASVYGPSAAAKTTVVLEGVSELYLPASAEKQHALRAAYGLQKPFLLFVGNAKQHKNIPVLISAFQKAALADTELVLVTGGPEAAALSPLPPGVRMLSGLKDEELPVLYSAARAMVTASLYEGYCLPVAEALACGCPVIASNRTAIPEVAGGHAMLVEPAVEAFADAFAHLPPKSAPYIAGTWTECARKTAGVLRDALQKI